MAEIVDTGLFGPGSASWQVNRETTVLFGGARALLMQAAHPLVLAGARQTGFYERDPWKRLERTLQLTYKITFGTREEALEAARRINAVHQGVRGIDEVTGRAYDASDPNLLLWVHACLVDSQLLFERLTVGRLDQEGRERFHQEQMKGAELLGLDRSRIPATVAGLRRYIEGVVGGGELVVSADTMRVADLIRHPPPGVPWRPVLRFVSRWAFGTLPEPLRSSYGVRWNAIRQANLAGSLGTLKRLRPLLPERVREIFPARQAARRIAAAGSLLSARSRYPAGNMADHPEPVLPPEPVPDLAWDPDRARRFADRTVDLWVELLKRLPELPVAGAWSSEQVAAGVARPIPDEPLAEDELIDYLRSVAFDWSMYPGHPRFMAYISGTGTVPGAPADLLAAGLNMNLGGWRLSPSGTEIELALVRWFADRFGLPESAGGFLVSGGAMANFVALKAARDAKAPWDVRNHGVRTGPALALYASEEVHVVVDRAADMLGLGIESVRKIPVDDRYRMRVEVLQERLEQDRSSGIQPIAVVGSAGTVATGSIDPLEDIAELCAERGLWFHVDGAYGGPAVLADDLRPLLAGIERADSIAFDPHKWLYTPHSGGCVLLRDSTNLVASFAAHAAYVHEDKERSRHGVDLGMMGPQFSRGFQALKVWVSLLAHGRRAYARRISHDAELARYMAARVVERPEFELSAPVVLSICCFRYVPPGLPGRPGREEYLDLLNERLMTAIHLDGRAFCSNAVLGGRFVLRACIVNFRTEAEDVDATLDVAAELGAKLDDALRPEALRPP